MNKRYRVPEIPESEQTPTVKMLLLLLEQFAQRIHEQDEEIARLKDEINRLKGQPPKPTFKGNLQSGLEGKEKTQKGRQNKKRPGSKKTAQTSALTIHEEVSLSPCEPIPADARFKGYQDFVVQELQIRAHNTRYRLARWVTSQGEVLKGQLPSELNGRHFGPQLVSYMLYQHHHCQTTQPLLLEQLREWGIEISSGQVNELLISGWGDIDQEKESLLQTGLSISPYVTVDDSGARHQGKNGYVTQIGNELFAWFSSTNSKSRINFLGLLRSGESDYQLTESALSYMKAQKLPLWLLTRLHLQVGTGFPDPSSWDAFLAKAGITNRRHVRIVTEGAWLGSALVHGLNQDLAMLGSALVHGLNQDLAMLGSALVHGLNQDLAMLGSALVHGLNQDLAMLGSALVHGLNQDLAIISDDAGQFDVLRHGLCWVHMERLIEKLIPPNARHREDIEQVRESIWKLYRDLKAYRQAPTEGQRKALTERFDELFSQHTSYATLNRLLERIHQNKPELLLVLERIHQNKPELLLVLERPEVPLHTNGSERDIREYVKRRKVRGGTRSEEGRRCRDAFASLKKTWRKLGVSFWDYLLDRVRGDHRIPPLPDIMLQPVLALGF